MSYELITLTGITIKKSEKIILNGIDLNIDKGKITAIIGSSGSGKTTLLKLILDLLFVEHGWNVKGNITRFPGLKMAYINQNPALQVFKNYVYEEFTTYTKNETEVLLQSVNCAYLLEKRSLELSQGEKTIIALLRALSYKVDLIVLDEIMINLSANKKLLIKKLLLEFKAAGGTLVIADHDKSILDLSDHFFLIENGSITASDKQFALTFLSDEFAPDSKYHLADLAGNQEKDFVIEQISDELIAGSTRNPIAFCAKAGEIIGIAGDNGSGKSTLLEILAGIKKPQQGTIKWAAKELKNLRARKNLMTITTEESSQHFYTETVAAELKTACSDITSTLAKTILNFFAIMHLENRVIDTLSYGEKQRLAITLNMIADSRILLFDEPTYGMDKKTRHAFISSVRFLANRGSIIVIASHEMMLLSYLTDKIINL